MEISIDRLNGCACLSPMFHASAVAKKRLLFDMMLKIVVSCVYNSTCPSIATQSSTCVYVLCVYVCVVCTCLIFIPITINVYGTYIHTGICNNMCRACSSERNGDDDGSNAVKRGTQLLDIFALQILMHSRQRDKKKLRYVSVTYTDAGINSIVCIGVSHLGTTPYTSRPRKCMYYHTSVSCLPVVG